MSRSVPSALTEHLRAKLHGLGGWMSFETFMSEALYAPGMGYYNRGAQVFGHRPEDGSDFVTSPELSPFFGMALARQVSEAMDATGTSEIVEFGAGSGALAAQLLDTLGDAVKCYTIIDLSGDLRARQQACVAARAPAHLHKLAFASTLPEQWSAILVGNEVLDAMPVRLLVWSGEAWLERGVRALTAQEQDILGTMQCFWAWSDRETSLRPPYAGPFLPGTVVEIHPQAEAFIRTVGERLVQGAAFFIDYGFPEAEFYHPQRIGGTLMCHHRHLADGNALVQVGEKDITAHVNFTGIALAAQEAKLCLLGYTSQARFLLNCGLTDVLADASVQERGMAQKLVTEHEMGELFKVIGFAPGKGFDAMGFAQGDRSHTL